MNPITAAASRLAAIVDAIERIANDPTYNADRSAADDKARAESFATALRDYRDAIANS